MPFIQTADLNMYYERGGEGATRVLFINGSGGDLRAKPTVMDGPAPKPFDFVAYDQRGLGQTDIPPGPYTMADYADDAARLMDALGWEDAHVYGVSFGGMVAQNFVIRHPDRVNRLVLACTSPGGEEAASFPLHTLGHLTPRERFEFMMGVNDTRFGLEWQQEHPDQVEKRWEFSVNQRKDIPVTPDSERGAFLQLEARKDHDVLDRLGEIKSPTFICGGKYDGIAPPVNLELLRERIPDSRLKFYEGGHLFLIQDRTSTPDIIRFLQGEEVDA